MRSVLANHDDPNDEIDPLSTGSVDDILHPRPSSSARGERRMQTIPEDAAPNSDPIDEEAADSDNAKPTYYFDEILVHLFAVLFCLAHNTRHHRNNNLIATAAHV